MTSTDITSLLHLCATCVPLKITLSVTRGELAAALNVDEETIDALVTMAAVDPRALNVPGVLLALHI